MTPTVTDMERQAFELAGMPSGWTLFAGFMAVAASCYIVIWLYRREGRAGSSARLRAVLGALRCLVVLTLAAIALEPVLATYRESTKNGRVLVLYDASGSMDIRDPASDQPGVTRTAALRSLLEARDYSWLRRLAEKNELSMYAFGDGMERVPLPWDVRNAESLPLPGKLRSRTDVGDAVAGALDDVAGAPLAGVIVLSDGAANRGADAEAIAALAKARKVSLYTVGLGAAVEPENLRVAQFSGPGTAPLNDPFELAVDVAATGLDAVEADVEIRVAPEPEDSQDPPDLPASAPAADDPATDAGALLETRRVTLEPGAAPTTLKLQVTPKNVGRFRYSAVIPTAVEDANPRDNRRDVSINITDEQYRVLLIAGRPSYEYRFLTSLLERDKSVNLSVWLQSADESAVRDGNTVITELPRKPEDLFAYDVLILLDPYAPDFDSAWAAHARRLVDEFRGGLLVVAGPHFSSRFLRDERLGELVGILPVTPDDEADVRLTEAGTYRTTPMAMTVPDESRLHPLMALGGDPNLSARLWASLPGVYWHLPVDKEKPVATVLLRSATTTPGDRSGPVLFAVQPVAGGRSAFLAFDTTWRWRSVCESCFNRFWVQTVRFLGQGRREEMNRRGTLTLDRDVVSLGDYVKIEARVLDAQFVPWFESSVTLSIANPDQTTTPLPLSAIPDRPGWFGGRWLFDQPGATALRLDLPGEPAESVGRTVRVQPPDFELRTLRQRSEFLQELATRTGGQYLPIGDADRLPDLLTDASQTTVIRDPQPKALWDRSWLLGTLAGLLAVEWTLRRRNHLL